MIHLAPQQTELTTILNMIDEIAEIVTTERNDHTLEATAATLADMEALTMVGDELRLALQEFAKSRLAQSRDQIDRAIDRLDTHGDSTTLKGRVLLP